MPRGRRRVRRLGLDLERGRRSDAGQRAQIEGAAEDVVGRQRFEFGQVEAGEEAGERGAPAGVVRPVADRFGLVGVAGVEDHGAAAAHEGVDAGEAEGDQPVVGPTGQ